jgi:hypothetical protein
MGKPTNWNWEGQSGAVYAHAIWPFADPRVTWPANYIFVRRGRNGARTPLFIAHTDNMTQRWKDQLGNVVDAAARLGANELHLHWIAVDRAAVEADLRKLRPSLLSAPSPALEVVAEAQEPDLVRGGGGFEDLSDLAEKTRRRAGYRTRPRASIRR